MLYNFEEFCTDSFKEVLVAWLETLEIERNYAPKTLGAYRTDLLYFIKFFFVKLGAKLTIQMVEQFEERDYKAWLSYRNSQNFSPASTARAMSSIRGLYKFMIQRKLIGENRLVNVCFPKSAKRIPRSTGIDDVFSFLDEIVLVAKDRWQGLRDKAILTLIYGCGLRISEALSIKRKDLSGDSIIIKGKGNKERVLPKLDAVNLAISAYLGACPYFIEDDALIFLGKGGRPLNPGVFQRQIRSLRRVIGVDDATTPHSFRHSFATHLLNNGVDIRTIQALLGHKNLSTTQRYTDLDITKLKQEYTKFSKLTL